MTRLLTCFLALTLSWGVHADADGAAQRLAAAVRFATVSHQHRDSIDYAEFERFHAFLRGAFPRSFAAAEVEVVGGYSLLLRWPGSDPALAPVLFTAHMDVVPIEPGTEDDWEQPPFAGVVADGRIYGRGTLDDKQGLLGLLEAMEQLLADGFSPRRGLVFAFGHDEEIGGRKGAGNLARRLRELDQGCAWMVDEGGMLMADGPLLPGRPVALVNVAEKAYVTLTLVATGEGGHSSRPPATSTIGRLAAALLRIEDNPYPVRLSPPVAAMLEAMAPHMAQPRRFVFENLWLTGPLVARYMGRDPLTGALVRSTTALTMIDAGVKENVVPQRAEAKVNFRLLPGDTPEALVQRVRSLVDDPQIEILSDGWNDVPPISDHRGEGFEVIAGAVAAVYPDAVVLPSLLFATTDTRHYIGVCENQYRFHGVLVSAAQASSVHGTNEYIEVASYEKSIAVARQLLVRAGAGPGAGAPGASR